MIKNISFLFLFFSSIFADDTLLLQRQNTLYTQNLITKEEEIAKAYEKYLLTEFKIPTINALQINDYLGSNFSFKNNLGVNLAFSSLKQPALVYAISPNSQEYINLLYQRDLYRDYTTVKWEKINNKIDLTKSYVEIRLKSKEAQTIFAILQSKKEILSNCNNPVDGKYCNLNEKVLRYYDSSGNWIEYSKKDFTNGNVNVSNMSIFDDVNLKNSQLIGTYAIVKNTDIYIKFDDGFLKAK